MLLTLSMLWEPHREYVYSKEEEATEENGDMDMEEEILQGDIREDKGIYRRLGLWGWRLNRKNSKISGGRNLDK